MLPCTFDAVDPPETPMTLGHEPPELLQSRLFYKGRKFNFEVNSLRLPNQAEGDWECIRHPGGALAVPVTKDGRLVMVRQYRFAMMGRLLEFPAGTLEPQEVPADTIRRELQEETGYRAATWSSLGTFPLAPGYSDEIIYAFLATDLEPVESPGMDEDEDLEVVLLQPTELQGLIRSGAVIDAKSIASFFLAQPFL
jgi:ADP-ribose pyrophosphatase